MKIFQSGDPNSDRYGFFFCEGEEDLSLVWYRTNKGYTVRTYLDNFHFHKNDKIIMELKNENE